MSIKIVPINKSSLALRVLIGALIGLLLISLFLLGPGIDSNSEWGRYWRIRPLIIVPSAGAMGGLFNYMIVRQDYPHTWVKILALTLSVIVFLIGLWLGFVLGLDGTYWN